MPPYPISSFNRAQVTTELRFDEAFHLWDRAGAIWLAMGHHFKTLKNTAAAPNQTTFVGDNRFGLSVAINQAIITDHKPSGGAQSTTDMTSKFANTLIQYLEIPVLKRVGTRFIYRLACESAEDARSKMKEALPIKAKGMTFFNIAPERFSPHLKLDVSDGELAYTVQFHANERTYDFEPPPEVADLALDRLHKTINEVVLDIDFHIVKPIPTESFDFSVWSGGWHKSISKDADALLDYFRGIE